MMPTLIIRDVPEDIVRQLDARALAAGKSREAWLRDELAALAQEVQVRTNYIIHFAKRGENGFGGAVMQHDGSDEGSYLIGNNYRIPQIAFDTYFEARRLVGRNQLGDREAAMALLAKICDDVYETPYRPKVQPEDENQSEGEK
ncbi:MAG: FitA-like ribbon-helix-helix domain-containing protein [Ktedonobacterales bacterium]